MCKFLNIWNRRTAEEEEAIVRKEKEKHDKKIFQRQRAIRAEYARDLDKLERQLVKAANSLKAVMHEGGKPETLERLETRVVAIRRSIVKVKENIRITERAIRATEYVRDKRSQKDVTKIIRGTKKYLEDAAEDPIVSSNAGEVEEDLTYIDHFLRNVELSEDKIASTSANQDREENMRYTQRFAEKEEQDTKTRTAREEAIAICLQSMGEDFFEVDVERGESSRVKRDLHAMLPVN